MYQGLLNLALCLIVPVIAFWFLLRRVGAFGRWWPIIIGGLLNGAIFSLLLMGDDANEGFCCREYRATAWAEIPLSIAFAAALAVVGAVAAFMVDNLMRWRRR